MDIMEIVLLVAGAAAFVLSFFIPDPKGAEVVEVKSLTEEERKKLIQEELSTIQIQMDDLTERTERSLEKLSNEKIMAVDEYSETVLAEIHKNHEEAMFLYDMLNNKHISLKNTLAEVGHATKEAREAAAALQDMMSRMAAEKPFLEQEAEGAAAGRGIALGLETRQDAGSEEPAEEMVFPVSEDAAGTHNKERILTLYQQGKSAMAIAKELELGIGEVRLVLDLFRKS